MKEAEIIEAFKKTFKADDIKTLTDNDVIMLSGTEGAGKTHMACTISELMPVYFMDTENRAHKVVRKFEGSKHPIHLYQKQINSYLSIKAGIEAITATQPAGAIVIDSGTQYDLWAQDYYLYMSKKDKIYPITLWNEIYRLIDVPIETARKAGFTVIMTTRMKEVYRNDKATGELIPRIYNRAPYISDLMLTVTKAEKDPVTLTKNSYKDDIVALTFDRDATLPQILTKAKE